jgi:Uncharacterized conserved protein
MKLVYPAIFIPFEDGSGGYTIEFPDLPGCVSEGSDLADALFMAEDAASGWILSELEEGNKVPKSSRIEKIKEAYGGLINLVPLDMDSYAAKYGNKSVKKTLTLPAWMNTYVEEHNISCSKILQNAISELVQA